MTTKVLTGTYSAGYNVNTSKYNALELTATARVGGTGVQATDISIANYGTIAANAFGVDGVTLFDGGSIQNGLLFSPASIIGGTYGIFLASHHASDPNFSIVNNGYIGGGSAGIALFEYQSGHAGVYISNFGNIHGGGSGIYDSGITTVVNYGNITSNQSGGASVFLRAGGYVKNIGYISGNIGVLGGDSLSNAGTIQGQDFGVYIGAATLTNGSLNNGTALIEGAYGLVTAGGTVTNYDLVTATNFGTIVGGSGQGIRYHNEYGVRVPGLFVNGAVTDTTALVRGFSGIEIGGSLANYGVIDAVGASGKGVLLDSGQLTNGSSVDLTALIEGYGGVREQTAGSTILNFGTIRSTAAGGGYGVSLDGGRLINGAPGDAAALIQGAFGAGAATLTTVQNYGVITGTVSSGVQTVGGGVVVNGSLADKKATIRGVTHGIASFGAVTNVTNFGTVRATGAFSSGVYEYAAGATITNGAAKDKVALIVGAVGVMLDRPGALVNSGRITGVTGAGVVTYGGSIANAGATAVIQGVTFGIQARGAETVTNLGTVLASGGSGAFGIALNAGGALINGSAAATGALIQGFGGASLAGAVSATLINFGTIVGKGGIAVQFNSSADTLVVEAASTFTGAVNGAGGAIVLANGVGALSLLAGDSLLVSGSMAATTFSNFGTIGIGAGATFTDSAAVTIALGQTINDSGTLFLGGAAGVVNAGTLTVTGGSLTVNGAVTGNGLATINGGVLNLASGFTQNVTFTGTTGVLELARSQTYTGSITGFSLTGGTSLDLRDIGFVSSGEASFSGTATSGTLTVSDGVHTAKITLVGDFLGSTFTAGGDGHGGVIVVDPPGGGAAIPSPNAFIAAMASLAPGGAGAAQTRGMSQPHEALILSPRTAIA